MREKLNKELAIAIEEMTTAKLALRATAPLSLRCQDAYVKYRSLVQKVNSLFKQIEAI